MTDLTPSEELVLEVLAARWRLGERMWTFSTKQKRAVEGLAEKGLVNMMHGIVEKSVRASLTEAGKLESLDEGYVPPIYRDLKKSRRKSW